MEKPPHVELLERHIYSPFRVHVPEPWGFVVADDRFPALWDANCAVVTAPSPDLRLAVIREALRTAAQAPHARHEHIVLADPTRSPDLLSELRDHGGRIGWTTHMIHQGPPPPAKDGIAVEPCTDLDGSFWDQQRRAFRYFNVADGEAVEQLIELGRLLATQGKRWWTARLRGTPVAFGALQIFGELAYIDDVVTFPEARGRGFASAIVTHLVEEATGSHAVMLMTETGAGPAHLYERLGFRETGRTASSLRLLL